MHKAHTQARPAAAPTALQRYAILGSGPEEEFDDITRMAAGICEAPVSLIRFGAARSQWFKGLSGAASAASLEPLACFDDAVSGAALLEIGDLNLDSRYGNLAPEAGALALRFYAAVPLLTPEGLRVGFLCVLDHQPRALSAFQRQSLLTLGRMVTRQMEARLLALESHRSKAFFETLVNHCPVGISVKKIHRDRSNGSGFMMYWNPAAEEMTGVSAESVLGRNNHQRFAPDRAARNAAHENEVLNSRVSVTVPVYPVVRDDGSTRQLRMTSIPLLDAAGEVEYILTIGEDNTDLLEQQKALRRSHAELAAINDALPLGLYHTDPVGRCSYLNRSAEDIIGLQDGAALELGWLQTVHPTDMSLVKEEFFLASRQQRLYQSEFRFLHADGRIVDVRARAAPFSVDGVFSGYVGTLDDITERQALSRSVTASERRLRLVIDNIPALVTHVNRDLNLLYMNSMGKRLFDMVPEQIIGKPISENYPPGVIEKLMPHILRVLEGESVQFETHLQGQAGDRYFQSHYIPDLDEHGVVVGFFGMAFNVTERKQAELQLSANEKRLRLITDNLPVAITYMNPEHCYQFTNATMQDWYGRPGDPLQDLHAGEVLSQEEYYADLPYLERALSGQRVDYEQPPTVAQPRYLHTTYLPDISGDGEVMGIYTLSNDISALKQNEATLQQMARFDLLTGLPNRGNLYETLEAAQARCSRAGTAISVLFLDIDHFKQINDALGHARGDLVLKEFAVRLMASIRGTDMAARLAGDEFVILLEGVRSIDDANLVASKVLEQVARPWQLNGEMLSVSTSIGVAYDESHRHSGAELIAIADEMLYAAKAAGRATFRTRQV